MIALIHRMDAALRLLLMVTAGVLVGCVVWQVASRYVMAAPSTVTDEIGRFTLMWFSLLGAAYVLGQRRHLAIDLAVGLKPGPAKRALSVALTLVIAFFVLVAMVLGGWRLMQQTLASGQVTPTLRLPMGYVYAIVPLSGALMLVYCLDILRTALGPTCAGPNDPTTPEERA